MGSASFLVQPTFPNQPKTIVESKVQNNRPNHHGAGIDVGPMNYVQISYI